MRTQVVKDLLTITATRSKLPISKINYHKFNPCLSKPNSHTNRLEARWITVNDQLICQWIKSYY